MEKFKIEVPDKQLTRMIKFFQEERASLLSRVKELNNEVYEIDRTVEYLSEIAQNFKVLNINYKKIIDSLPQSALFNPAKEFTNTSKSSDYPIERDYNNNWSWPEKAAFVLRKTGFCLSVRQIIDVIVKEYQPELNNIDSKREMSSKISAVLKMKFDKKSVFSRYPDTVAKEIKYGLIDWADKHGEISDRYKK